MDRAIAKSPERAPSPPATKHKTSTPRSNPCSPIEAATLKSLCWTIIPPIATAAIVGDLARRGMPRVRLESAHASCPPAGAASSMPAAFWQNSRAIPPACVHGRRRAPRSGRPGRAWPVSWRPARRGKASPVLRASPGLLDALGNRIVLAHGIPRQELGTFSERLLIPLIHFILPGLPPDARHAPDQAGRHFAGCGQLF